MPKFCLIFICLLLTACGPGKSTVEMSVSLVGECPADGHCAVVAHPGKALQTNTDEYGNLHYGLIEDRGQTVYVVTYDRKVPKGVQDGTYREEVIFQLPAAASDLELEGAALQKSKLLFGRFCFCKGQTGYYAIDHGTLQSSRKGKQQTISIAFQTTQTPQVLTNVRLQSRLRQ